MELSEQQEEAIRVITNCIKVEKQKLTYLAGYAGTGKSTILPYIIDALGLDPFDVAFLAPTGQAAKVMRRKLRDQKAGNILTSTIHSAIYRPQEDDISVLEMDLTRLSREKMSAKPDRQPVLEKQIRALKAELEQSYQNGSEIVFHLNLDSAIQKAKLIVVDEGTMVGTVLANDLKYFDVPIFVMGDPGQLPPINDDYGLTGGKPDYFLTDIRRQAKDNPIIFISGLAREKKQIKYGFYGEAVRVVPRNKYSVQMFDNTLQAPQLIVGANKTRWMATRSFRDHFLGAGTSKLGPRKQEPLIVCRNSREHPNLVNGTAVFGDNDINLIKGESMFKLDFRDEDGYKYKGKVFQGKFEEHFSNKIGGFTCTDKEAYNARKKSFEMDWAWAITTHKSQGSQWDDVCVIDESFIFGDFAANHLYTAITRAAKALTLVM